jgi:DNA-directed RNA polymerase subunit F
MNEQQQVNRGELSERLMSLLASAFTEIEQSYFEKFNKLDPKDIEGMTELKRQSKSLNDLQEILEHYASTGRIAKTKLEKIKSKVGL